MNDKRLESLYDSRLTTHELRQADEAWMRHALELAERAEEEGEVPVGALVVIEEELVAEGWNRTIDTCDPTGHAEIIALRAATNRVGNYRLPGSTLYVTLEPCVMCAGAIVQARVSRLVYGAADAQAGAAGSAFNLLQGAGLNHESQIIGDVLGDVCSERLRAFFEHRR
jgi:tRNA(adenine34) deaminase